MKVSISGTFSSGKTSIVNALRSRLPDATILHEHAREVKTRLPQIDWRSIVVRHYLLMAQIQTEEALSPQSETLICDSGIIDAIAHSIVFGHDPELEIVQRYQSRRYTGVFVCDPSEVALENDGLRFTDEALRSELHNAILHVCSLLRYSPVLLRGSKEARVDAVCQWLTRPN